MNSRKMIIVRFLFNMMPACALYGCKRSLLRWAGAKVGNNVRIMSSAKIFGNMNLAIGNNVYIGHEALIMGNKGSSITLEDHCVVGSRVVIVTGFHKITPDADCIEGEGTTSHIRVCKGAAVSTNSTILPGITVSQMSHVAAGAVVTKDVPEYTRVAGVPARVIKEFK